MNLKGIVVMSEEKIYQFNEYVLGYDKGENDRSALTISKVLNNNMYIMATLTDGSADVIILMLDELNKELQQKENIIKKIREYIENTPKIVRSIYLRDKESNFVFIEKEVKKELLEILDKENNNENN
jgi:hypothetical protein